MPTYSITGPDGKVYSIDGPPGATQEQVIAQIQAQQKAAPPPPEAQPRAPLWDIPGDIGRAAKDSAGAVVGDFNAAFPSFADAQAQHDENRGKYGFVGGFAKDVLDTGGRAVSALKIPLDAAGVALSPITGAAHAIGGSALSYVTPTIPGDDPKKMADETIDKAMMGVGPRGMEVIGGPRAAMEVRNATNTARREAAMKNKAQEKVAKRATEDGLTAQQVIDAQQEANANGDKLTLMDIGKENVRGLAGAVYRAPGQAKQTIGGFLDDRDAGASAALVGDLQGNVGAGSTYNAQQVLLKARSEAAGPAFKEAFAADSTAPFEDQFRDHLIASTGKKGHIARQIADIEAKNPGALVSRGAVGADVRAKYVDLHEQLKATEAERVATQEKFQKAQADRTANAPGAVWSPRLQQFLDDPDVMSGLKRALRNEKRDAVSEGRPFKDGDYSIVGYDQAGDPVLGEVPTMKSLAVAKEGLDARVAEMRDPQTGRPTKDGLALKKFRDAFVGELDKLNPRYKAARDAWSGPSQSMEAIRDGRDHFSRTESNEQIKAEFDALSPNDKEFYRLGAAEAKVDALERAPDASDKSKRVINSERDRKRFAMLFDTPEEAQRFIESVARKRTAFETKNAVKGNSATAARQVEDEDHKAGMVLEGAKGVRDLATGNWFGLADRAMRLKQLGINNPALNSEIANILTDPNLAVGREGNFFTAVPLPERSNYLAKTGAANVSLAAARRAASKPTPNEKRK